jgi:hypothetical protein
MIHSLPSLIELYKTVSQKGLSIYVTSGIFKLSIL